MRSGQTLIQSFIMGNLQVSAMGWMKRVLAGLCLMAAAPAYGQVLVQVPAGMVETMREIADEGAKEGAGFKVLIGYGPLNAHQVAEGTQGDLLLSSAQDRLKFLELQGMLESEPPIALAKTGLVLAAPADSRIAYTAEPGASLAAALGNGRLALCRPDKVPLGRFAQGTLERLDAWADVKDRLETASDPAGVLTLLRQGKAAAGIVLSVDLAGAGDIKTIASFPETAAPPVLFQLVYFAGRKNPAAERVAAFLRGPKAQDIFRKHGLAAP